MNKEKIKQLEDEIKKHDEAYWILQDPLIEDHIYDKKVNKLLELEPDNEYLKKPKTPVVDSKGKVKHKIKMLSLDKVYSFVEILKWCKKVARDINEKFKIMPKYDGVSGQLIDGVLATRGDGEVGEDITHKLPFMEILKANPKENNVRGEILFLKSKFKEIKDTFTRKSGEKYKNERNAVGGILTRDDIKVIKVLTFIDFNHTVIPVTLKTIEEDGQDAWDDMVSFMQDIDYPVDGIVVQLEDEKYGKSLGTTRHHAKDSIAFKFANPFKWSKIIGITWSMGKHVLTPIIQIEPIEVSGVIIKNVSGHNMKNILDKDICIGDIVKVERAGDVIPFITEVKYGKKRVGGHITKCPECGSNVTYIEPELVCENPTCTGKHLNTLMDAVERIGIERLGKPTLNKMIKTLNVKNLVDIFNLTKNDILKLEGFKETSANNLYNEIQKPIQEGVYEWQLLACLNIEGIGRSLSKDLLEGTTLFNLSSFELVDWNNIPGIGPERANALINGFLDNSIYLNKLTKILPIKNQEVKTEGLIKVCFTGRFPKKKAYYYDLLNKNYEILEKVKDIDMLVVADPSKQSNKMKAALKKGIKIIGIDELLENLIKK